MKKKDLAELKTKSISQLTKMIADLEKEKVKVQLELKMGKIKNVHLVKMRRKEIAQAKTILSLKRILARRENGPS